MFQENEAQACAEFRSPYQMVQRDAAKILSERHQNTHQGKKRLFLLSFPQKNYSFVIIQACFDNFQTDFDDP